MELHLRYWNLKKILKPRWYKLGIWLFVIAPYASFSQSLNLIKEISIPPAQTVSIDPSGNVYVASTKGDVFKYGPDGKELIHYSPIKPAEITLLEAWNPLRIFLFYADFQEYVFLDRFLVPSPIYRLDEGISDFANTIAPSLDNNIWFIDIASFSLQKFDINFNTVLISTPLELILNPDDYEIGFMREYQNILFVNDRKSGILVFDNLGNYIRKINKAGLTHFYFADNFMYFMDDGAVIFEDIYGKEEKAAIKLPPEEHNYNHVLIHDTKLYAFLHNELKIYELK